MYTAGTSLHLIPNRAEKVHAEKLLSVLVSNEVHLPPKQKGNTRHEPIPSNLKGNSNIVSSICVVCTNVLLIEPFDL